MKKGAGLKCGIVLLFLSAGVQAATGMVFLFNLLRSHPRLFTLVMEIHEWNGPILVMLIIVHISMNKDWLKSQLLRRTTAPNAGARHRLQQSQPREG